MNDSHPLCETCGYDLAGTPPSGACPECGRPAAASSPQARPGTAFQRRPGLWSWVTTNWHTLTKPVRTFSQLRIHPRGVVVLMGANLWLAGACLADPWVGTVIGDPARAARDLTEPRQLALYGLMWLAWGLAAGLLLLGLTAIEYAGVRFFAARRGWRLTRAAAWQVCAHASVGWILCGASAIAILAAIQACVRLFRLPLGGVVNLGTVRIDTADVLLLGGPLLGYAIGLLVFETLVYRGVRACRYAARAPG
jgi:hypothetical protein